MEIMEDGNLMDRIHILIERDMDYYKSKQTVLQESICPGVVGGRLDFPRNASFAAVKLVIWWEEEYIAAYRKCSGLMQDTSPIKNIDIETTGGCGGIVKSSDPTKFFTLISKSADRLLEHLHVLTQEALDHADLAVLTGTIGAATLLKNCLWFYIQATSNGHSSENATLQKSHKSYQEMEEALAERLLDLHCRLLSLYILQDADCLDWESDKPFFESERGSYVIQMWWLYMEGTRQDLWNTVPPRMAQRVFSGMLNESMTILTVRYTQACPTANRSDLLVVDISNLLRCVSELLPAVCETAEEYSGLSINSQSKVIRDIHAKCQELFTCLILRGSPLDTLNKVFRQGISTLQMLNPRSAGPSPWIVFVKSDLFSEYPKNVNELGDLKVEVAVALKLMVLLVQPQANWSLLLEILMLSNCKVLHLLLDYLLSVQSPETFSIKNENIRLACGGFLCNGDGICKTVGNAVLYLTPQHIYDLIMAITYVIVNVGSVDDISSLIVKIERTTNWYTCLDRHQVWNQKRPPWLQAIVATVQPLLSQIIKTAVSAVQTGASMYQAMSVVLACLTQLCICFPTNIIIVASLLSETLPGDVTSLGNSALLQILICALYSEFLEKAEQCKSEVKCVHFESRRSSKVDFCVGGEECASSIHKNSITSFDGTVSSEDAIALALAEALCSIDEDNKHTEEIDQLLDEAKHILEGDNANRIEINSDIAEILASDLLMTIEGKRSLKLLNQFVKCNNLWLFQALGIYVMEETIEPNRMFSQNPSLLHTLFHVGNKPFDELLSNNWKPNWMNLLQTPMGISTERIWTQVMLRWQFRESYQSSLAPHDAAIVNNITTLFKQSQ